ncbi:MAG: hypothetical protein WCD11_12835, partial [Solirubrobacteraceae bacterium]
MAVGSQRDCLAEEIPGHPVRPLELLLLSLRLIRAPGHDGRRRTELLPDRVGERRRHRNAVVRRH